ncbi:MAG TPA: polysaccharide biosynthesis tyrosine autokinase [Armatimonadota bacterium]
MVNPKKPDGFTSRELVPLHGDYARPAVPEPVVGDYYYGRPQTKSAIARSYKQMLFRQRRTIILTFVLVMAAGLTWTLTRPPLYRAVAEMLVTPMDRGSGNTDNLAVDIGTMTRVRSVATEMKLLNSPDLLDEAFARLPESLRLKGFRTPNMALADYPIAITNPRDTDVVAVEVTARDPDAAARFANQILRTNMRRSQETTKNIAELATEHVNSELLKCDKALRQTLNDLAQFKQQSGVVDVNASVAATAQGLANLESQTAQAQSEAVRAKVSKQLLERELRRTAPTIVASINEADNPVLLTVNNQIEQLQQQRASLLQEYLPSAPEIRSIDQQIAEAMKRKADAMARRAQSVTTAHNPLVDNLQQNYINAIVAEQESASRAAISHTQAGAMRGNIAKLPRAEERITLLASRVTELQTTHAYLVSQQQALTLSMHGGLPNAMPITAARPDPKPVSPNIPASVVLLTVLASLLALGLAVVRDQLDDHLHSAETLEGITGRRVLVSLPQVRNGFRGLVTAEECPPALLESFRILRGNFLLSMLDPLPRTIMVTSPQAGDGKSTTVANLAATIALSGKRVLLMDCDMRHPSIHLIYGLDNARGLSTILQGEATFEECLQQSGVEGLDILPAGITAPHPPELLASPSMGQLLEELRERYDCVLLDSTPMINLSDGTILAALVEGAIVVVSSDRTRQPELQTALRTLEQVGVPILGLVHNRSADTSALEWRG